MQAILILYVLNKLIFMGLPFVPILDKFVTFSIILATIPISCMCILLSRMFFELIIVAFRIAENTGKIADRRMAE